MSQKGTCAVQGSHEAQGRMCSSGFSRGTGAFVQSRFIMSHRDACAVQGSHESHGRIYDTYALFNGVFIICLLHFLCQK